METNSSVCRVGFLSPCRGDGFCPQLSQNPARHSGEFRLRRLLNDVGKCFTGKQDEILTSFVGATAPSSEAEAAHREDVRLVILSRPGLDDIPLKTPTLNQTINPRHS